MFFFKYESLVTPGGLLLSQGHQREQLEKKLFTHVGRQYYHYHLENKAHY